MENNKIISNKFKIKYNQKKIEEVLSLIDIKVRENQDIEFYINKSKIIFKESGDIILNSGRHLFLNTEDEGITINTPED